MQENIIDALRKGEHAVALDKARANIAIAQDDPQAHRLLALAFAMTGGTAEAHAALDRAIVLAPDDANLHYQRASLLVAGNRSDEAQEELKRAIGFNPNEMRAYIMQAQLALGQGDLEEADRQAKLAGRINPDHPWLLTVQGMVLLHRQQLVEAHALISRASRLAPDDLQTRYAMGLSFLAQGHLAFAEEAFRGVIDKNPSAHSIRQMLADVIRRQGRLAEGAEIIEDGLAATDDLPPDMMRFAGEMWLVSGNTTRALKILRRAVAAEPDNAVALDALIEALRRQGDTTDARHTLEQILLASPRIEGLWSARLSFAESDEDSVSIAERWEKAMSESVHPLHVQMWLAARRGDTAHADAFAHRIIEREPGHVGAHTHLIEQLYRNDAPAAVRYIQALLPDIQDPTTMRLVLSWLARAHDRAGQYGEAVETWGRLDAIHDPLATALPARSVDDRPYAPIQAPVTGAAHPLFLFGPPGSGVERVVATLKHNLDARLRTDRAGSNPPSDPLQFPEIAHGLASGALDGETVVSAWRAELPARGAREFDVIDWLTWWDNALLHAFRESLPAATLLVVLVDPRDMLIDWLQRGTFVRYAIDSPTAIAAWLAGVLEQLATLVEDDLMSHRQLRIDTIVDDVAAIASATGEALGLELEPAPAGGPGRYPFGHWRKYRHELAEPFALLTPVARRLGYPEE